MKVKQKTFGIIMLMFICAGVLFIQSCSNEDSVNGMDLSNENKTKADLFVASPEFQAFQEDIENFAEDLRINYINLSESDRNEFNEILKIITEKDAENIEGLYEQMNSIIGINLKLKLNEIRENSFENINKLELNDISRKDLITAIKKQNLVEESSISRLKSGSEQDDDKLQKCKNSCTASYATCSLAALLTPPPADAILVIACTAAYLVCLDAC
ncbi:MAG: hypothetical protein LBV43_01895 [Prevotella sp.]|nr:hypothetical protein [Prevotella sp.]